MDTSPAAAAQASAPPLDEKRHAEVLAMILAKFPANTPSNLITAMQCMQAELGYLPAKLLVDLSRHIGISSAKVFGVATFYEQFRLTPPGESIIRVCHGTACHVKGAGSITKALEKALGIKDGETTPDGKYTLESVACLGACGQAPVMTVDEVAHGRLIPEAAVEIIEDHRRAKEENNG